MKQSKPNFALILTLLFGAFIAISATSKMVSSDSVIDSSNVRSATLYSYTIEN